MFNMHFRICIILLFLCININLKNNSIYMCKYSKRGEDWTCFYALTYYNSNNAYILSQCHIYKSNSKLISFYANLRQFNILYILSHTSKTQCFYPLNSHTHFQHHKTSNLFEKILTLYN